MMVVGGGGLILARLLLVDLGKVRDFKLVVIWSGLMTGLVLLSLAWLLPTDRITTQFYDLLGRDPTLTGRTALWDAARDISEDHLWFGVGLEGFWQYDVGSAQTLNENDYKPFGTKLGFHSAFWDVRVHLGLVGLGLFIWVIIWSVFRVTTRWMVEPSLNRSTFLLLAAVILGVSFTEGFLWGTFTVIVNIFYLAALADLGAGARRFLGLARVRVTETADMGDPT
jgi:exopolysaccharide production protein ExoQ